MRGPRLIPLHDLLDRLVDRQCGGIQQLRIRCGLERRDGALLSRASRSRKSPSKSSILAENPFSINCLYRRCRARLNACRQEHLQLGVRERSPCPCRGRRRPGPAPCGKPAARATSAWRTAGSAGDRRGRVADFLGADVVPTRRRRRSCAQPSRNAMCRCSTSLASASLVAQRRCRSAAPPARSAGTARRNRAGGSRGGRRPARPRCPCRRRSGRRW